MEEEKMFIHMESINGKCYNFKLDTYIGEEIITSIKNKERTLIIYYGDKRYYFNLDNLVKIEFTYLDN